MADRPRILGQLAPSATTLTDLFTVAVNTRAVVSTVMVCNRGATDTTFRVSVAINGAADTVAQYIHFDQPIVARRSWPITIGITLNAGDVIRVFAGNANLSFNAFGTELT